MPYIRTEQERSHILLAHPETFPYNTKAKKKKIERDDPVHVHLTEITVRSSFRLEHF